MVRGRVGAAVAACAVWACVAAPAAADEIVYIPAGSTWEYFKGLAEASSPIEAWRAVAFDDGAWLSGPAPFGYGELIAYGTELADMRYFYTTLFLRRQFTVVSPAAVNDLAVDIHYDDGFILWINGREVLRANAPDTPTYDALAPVSIEPTLASLGLAEPFDYLLAGENVLAVQFFNTSLTSSDLVFDLRLYDPIGIDTTPPAVTSLVPVEGAAVRTLMRIDVTFTEIVAGVDAADLRINGVAAAGVTGTDAGPYAFTFTQPPDGEVQVAWAADHGITDIADAPNAFAGGSWTYTLDPTIPFADLVINEFLASNRTILPDEDDEYSDWLELRNRGAQPVNLGGFALTDDPSDPGRWPIPAVTLDAGGYLVIFASGKDRRLADGELHTNFKLSADGEYLGLYRLDAPPLVLHEFAPAFPEQRGDYSYGLDSTDVLRYFQSPTPGAVNNTGTAFNGFVETPVPSVPHGVFAAPFSLILSSATPGAQIYWRTAPDGREPTQANATPYAGPIQIAGAATRAVVTLRAVAFRDGLLPSRIMTASYIFPSNVLTQPIAPPGFPSTWGNVSKIPGDYEIDPEVVTNPVYTQLALDALTTAPSLSIVMNIDDMFSPTTGIYSNAALEGLAWERATSAELIYPDGSKGCQIDCGIRIQGGSSTTPWKSPKLSLRLLFKDDYGRTKLRFPLFPDSPLREFDALVLDAHLNHVWHHPDLSQQTTVQYVRDTFASDVQNAMGSLAPHDVFLNLYINGVHWGMYDVHERPDEDFQSVYLGGVPEDYDVLKHNRDTVVSGTTAAFDDLLDNRLSDLATLANYERLLARLDALDFADYMITNLYIGNNDWSHQNWYVGRDRVRPGALFRFFSWDAEHAIDLGATWDEFALDAQDGGCPWVIFNAARKNAEFKLLFADRVHRHFFNHGVLYVDASAPTWNPDEPERTMPIARYMRRIEEIDALIVIESARWGDYRRTAPYTRADWLVELNKLLANWFPQRSQVVLGHFVREGLYPAVGAPVFSQHGGPIAPGFTLAMTKPAGTSGTIYYTTNGSDPRQYGTGAVAASAQAYAAPVALFTAVTVKARTRDGTTWSALTEAQFTTPSPFDALQVTEVMYHPPPGASLNADDYEFIEIRNAGSAPVDMSGVRFTRGIFYTFSEGVVAEPGEYLVLVADESAFSTRYPGIVPCGTYAGRLDNDWDTVELANPQGTIIVSFSYADSAWWPPEADGEGYSLVPVDPAARDGLSIASAWRISTYVLGSPGAEDGVVTPVPPEIVRHPVSVSVLEGRTASFSVSALGTPPPAYRWQKNGLDIPGATSSFLTTPPVTLADDGAAFRCIVSNDYGTVASNEAVLTVRPLLPAFVRGDGNADGKHDISDAIAILRGLFGGGTLACRDAADINDDGALDIADPIALLGYLFSQQAAPHAPFPDCGVDDTQDELDCAAFAPCP